MGSEKPSAPPWSPSTVHALCILFTSPIKLSMVAMTETLTLGFQKNLELETERDERGRQRARRHYLPSDCIEWIQTNGVTDTDTVLVTSKLKLHVHLFSPRSPVYIKVGDPFISGELEI